MALWSNPEIRENYETLVKVYFLNEKDRNHAFEIVLIL